MFASLSFRGWLASSAQLAPSILKSHSAPARIKEGQPTSRTPYRIPRFPSIIFLCPTRYLSPYYRVGWPQKCCPALFWGKDVNDLSFYSYVGSILRKPPENNCGTISFFDAITYIEEEVSGNDPSGKSPWRSSLVS